MLPPWILLTLLPCAPLFSRQVWPHVQVLLAGALLAPAQRTVAAVLRVVGLAHERRFHRYHRVLSHARWSGLAASRVLLRLLAAAFVPEGPLVFGVARRWSGAAAPGSRPRASTATPGAPATATSSRRVACAGCA